MEASDWLEVCSYVTCALCDYI